MSWDTGIVLVVVGVINGALLVWFTMRMGKSTARPLVLPSIEIVEAYRLSYETDRTGKPRVVVFFDVASGGTRGYEFAPPYAYVLSNELCKVAVQNAPRKSVNVSDTIDTPLDGVSD